MSTATSSSSAAARSSARAGQEVVDRRPTRAGGRAERHRRAEADERPAGLHRGRGVHHVAADRPLGAGRVRADDRAGVGERGEALADVAARGDLGVGYERAEPQPAGARRCPRSSTTRWIATTLSGSVALPARHRRRGRCRPRRAGRRSASAAERSSTVVAVDVGWHGHAAARLPHPLRRHRQLCTRAPITFAIAFAIAPGGRHARRLADALRPLRARVRRVGLDPRDVDPRRVGRGHELVVGQVRVAVAAVLVELRALGQRLADPHHDAAVHLPVGADPVEDLPQSCAAATCSTRADAGLPVDPHAHGVRDQLRGVERLEPEPADAALGGRLRAPRAARPRPCRGTCRRRRARRS